MRLKLAIPSLLASTLAFSVPTLAALPVIDKIQETLMIKELAESAKQLATLVQMADIAVRSLTIENAMKLALGDAAGGAFASLMDSASGLYSSSNSLYYNVTNKQALLTAEINSMLPHMENMSFAELQAFALRWQGLLRQDTMQAREIEAEGLRIQSELRKAAAMGVTNSQKSQGVTSAVQSLTQVAGAMAGQLDMTNTTLSLLAQGKANEMLSQDRMNQTAEQIRKRDREILQQMLAKAPGRASISPINWGMP